MSSQKKVRVLGTTVRANGEGDITKLDATSLFFTSLKDQQTLFAYEVHPRTVVHNVFSKVFSYFPLIYVPLENISARPPIYVLFSKYEDSFVFQGERKVGGKGGTCKKLISRTTS